MAKHRYEFKRQWWQQKRHLVHLVHSFRLWLDEQITEIQDILTELKELKK